MLHNIYTEFVHPIILVYHYNQETPGKYRAFTYLSFQHLLDSSIQLIFVYSCWISPHLYEWMFTHIGIATVLPRSLSKIQTGYYTLIVP